MTDGTMLLARVHGAGDWRLDTVATPEIGPRDVLVRVAATGVCGSDLGFIAAGGVGDGAPLRQPLALGHEFAGVVERVGSEVRDIAPGLRCAVNPDKGMVGCGGPTGAFAPFVLVPDARLGGDICPIPDTLPLEKAALAEPLSVALHGIDVGRAKPGDKVAILGAGPIGLSTIICLRHRGVADIAIADLSDARLARAEALGATCLINSGRDALADKLGEAHGRGERFGMPFVGTDLFIDAAGSAKAIEDVLAVAKFRARIVVVALHKKKVPVDLWKMMANEFSIAGSIAADREAEFNACLRLLAEDAIDVEPLISHRIPFARLDEAFAVARDVDASAKVIVTYPEVAA